MFGLGKNKAQVDEFKNTVNECATLKEKINKLIENNNNLDNEVVVKAKNSLAIYEELKNDVLAIKNSSLRPKEKITAISNKKDSIIRVKSDLEKTKKQLEEKL